MFGSSRRRAGSVTTGWLLGGTTSVLLAGLFLLQPPGGPGSAAQPWATAAYQTTDNLLFVIDVAGSAREQQLTVELLDPKGKVIDSVKKTHPAGPATKAQISFGRVKLDLQNTTVRVTQNAKSHTTALTKILQQRAHETTLSASTEYYAGSEAELLCRVRGVRSLAETVPLSADVSVELSGPSLKAKTLFAGKTASDGAAKVRFTVPEIPSGQYTMKVTTKSALGEDTLERAVKVQSAPKVLLTSDKPLYQPGQTMHLRALALRSFDLAPAAKQTLTFEVEDAKGNKVCKKELLTSEYGIAATDFTLADEVNMGEYRVRAILGDQRSEKTVTVKKYVLPKFKVELKTDKPFYLPKETVKATLQVDYFFGKPVAGGKVEVKASTFDVAFKEFTTFKGTTDKNGHVAFDVKLPDYFVGTPLAGGNAIVRLDVKTTDTADHAEALTKTYPVSDQPIKLTLLPEAGRLIPGVENRLFVAALYPDGSPAACDVEVFQGQKAGEKSVAKVKTNDAGLGEIRVTPKPAESRPGDWMAHNVEYLGGTQQRWGPKVVFDYTARASDTKGAKATTTAALSSEPLGENLLLRLDKAIYKGGDKVQVSLHTTSASPTVYVDVVKGGQTMLTQWLDVKDHKATTAVELPPNVFGTLEVHAYQVLPSGEVVRDARVVYANPAAELNVKVTPDRDTYLPGSKGIVRFEVTDAKGKASPAALGVIIVDEAVYALQEIQPGLEKVFFTLQEELLKPQAQANYKPGERLDAIVGQPVVAAEKQQAAQALLTAVQPKPPARWQQEPAVTRRLQVQTQLAQVGWALYNYAASLEPVLERNKQSGKWDFTPDLLDKLKKTNHLQEAQLRDPLGGKMTLETVALLEPNFGPERLGAATTRARMQNLIHLIVNLAETNKARWQKSGKWTYPDDVVTQAAKTGGYGVKGSRDVWGKEMKLVKRASKDRNNTGHPHFDDVVLTSAGPDGRFGTDDDVRFENWVAWNEGMVWFDDTTRANLGDARWRLRDGGGFGFGGGPMGGMAGMALPAGPGGGGGFGGGFGGGNPAPMAAAAPKAMEMAPKAERATGMGAEDKKDAGGGSAPVMRLREYFPETLLWQPALITDDAGVASLEVPLADSITTWRLTASASSRGGLLGGVSGSMRVFQDFFVDLDLPVALTQNDEVAFPVAVYNYLKTPQTVTLELKREPWFDLIDDAGPTRSLKLEQGQVTAVRFRIKAKKVGTFPLTVEARGSKMSDAIKRQIEIVPDGKAVEQVFTDRLKGTINHKVTIPNDAIADASKLYVKVYPGVLSQVVEGLDGMLRMPGGCFEQTSSSAYPNILVVDYIKRSRLASPALLAKSEQFLSAGYQRLLTFERPGGGFDWWGSGEPLVWLSAYGLQEFNDMAKVWPIDRGIIDRTQTWLMKQQAADGTWANIGGTHGESIERMGDPKLLLTSYVAWSLLDSMPKNAGWEKTPEYAKLKKAIGYVRDNAPKAENAYILALAANALAAWDAKDDVTFEVLTKVLKKIDEQKQRKPEWNAVFFPAKGQSLAYARDDSLIVETTALATLAMIKNGQFTTSVNQALAYLVKTKSATGHWGSTQATILALKALLSGLGGNEPKDTTPFTVAVNGKLVATGEVSPKNFDVLQLIDLTPHLGKGDTDVAINVKGETSLLYQVVGRHFEPHGKGAEVKKPVLEVAVAYDRTKLTTADLLKATATLKYNGAVPTYNVIVDLPIPPGFTVDGGDFAELVAAKKVEKFSVTARQVILYLGDVKPGSEHTFAYSLKPKYPIKAKTPAAVAYEYYTPANRAATTPVEVEVK